MTSTESALTATIKAGKDFDAPWLVVRADDPAQLEMLLQVVENNTTFASLGRLATAFAAQFQLGKTLGARGEDAPQSAPAQAYAQPAAAPVYQAPAPAYAAPAAPAYQAAPAPAAGAPAGVPLVCGIPAKWIDKGTWKAWADPRPQEMTGPEKLKTDDATHPGLAGGTHKFWKFVR